LWIRVGVLVLALVSIVLGLWLALDARFYVLDPVVVGAETVPPERVLEASGLLGLHMLWVRPTSAAVKVHALDGVTSARVECKLPAKCTILIAEVAPVISWQDGGELWHIDSSGLAVSADNPLASGLYVQGPLPINDDERLSGPVLAGLLELSKLEVETPGGIYYTPDRGIAFVDERGWLVIVGAGPGMGKRISSLDRIAAALLSLGVQPEWVDVHIADRPVFRERTG
jgi:cell division septal protein FtsQ